MNASADPSQTDLDLRKNALSIFQAGVVAADPYFAVKRCLITENSQLQILLDTDGKRRTGSWSKIHLIAFGKAACPMIKGAFENISADYQIDQAIAVTNYENVTSVSGVEVIGAAHPLPDEAGFKAAKLCAEIAENAHAGELVLVLVSGGGSALIPYPVDSVTLAEKILTTDLLLASGATINQINCVRKHLSQLKGGGLARLIAPADCHTLILSDVIGDDLSAIASGSTIPDSTTFRDAIDILRTKELWQKIPDSVRHYLEDGQQGKVRETPKAGESFFSSASHTLIGSNTISVKAIKKAALEQGFAALLYSDRLCGEAKDEAEKFVLYAKAHICQTKNLPLAILAGGETTVTIKGKGKGGRNQEMALAFAIYAKKHTLTNDWLFLSGGTDGRDGPTDAAGGITDSCTIQRMVDAGINPTDMIDNNDSYTALKASHGLLMTGATGTNVADLQVLLIKPESNAIEHQTTETTMFNKSMTIAGFDDEIFQAIEEEKQRQEDHIELIASENYSSPRVQEAQGTCLTNKYAEGYPGKRYYGGCEYVDKVEQLAIDRAKTLFGADYANVQPHSGSQANMAVFMALIQPGDTILGLSLAHGGHLTHGAKPNFSGKIYNAVQYGLDIKTGYIDYDEVEALAIAHKPKVLVAGFSAYSRVWYWERFREIADKVGAYLFVDMAHVAGLVAAGVYPNPVPFADVVTTTTHKSLRGPRGGLILCKSNPELEKKFDSNIFPGIQGGPLMHVIAAKAVSFKEAMQPEFKVYQEQVVLNARAMAKVFMDRGFDVVSGGTDNHLMLVSLIPKGITGKAADAALGKAHITVNKNAVPNDPQSPFVTSGIRVGTPAPTTRGFKEPEVIDVANWMCDVMENMEDENVIATVREKVTALCKRFPVYG